MNNSITETGAPSAIAFVQGDEAVTTSLAIAEGTQNDHASVIKLVRTYEADLTEFGRVGFEIQSFKTAGGMQVREVAILNEEQATLIMTYMKNGPVARQFKKALVRAFYDLKKQTVAPKPIDLTDAATVRALLLNFTETNLVLQAKITEQAPKVEALDRLATRTDGALCVTDAAKALQMPPKQLFDYLSRRQWIYRRAGGKSWMGYQDKVQRGLLEHKVTTITVGGEEKLREQVLVTACGLAALAEVLTPLTLAAQRAEAAK